MSLSICPSRGPLFINPLLSIILLLLGLGLPGCQGNTPKGGASATPASASASPSAEAEPLARTEFTDKMLNFFEFEPLKPGVPSRFLIHLSDQRDGSPVKEATVTLQLRGPNGQKLETVTAKVGRVTGIYVADVKVAEQGTYGIDFHVKNDKLDETMALRGFEVSASPPTPTPEPETTTPPVAFLMEQQWLIEMKLAKVEKRELAQPIASTGRLVPAANSHAIVASPVSGTITGQNLPRIGQKVSSGETVAVVAETATASETAQLRASLAQVESAQIQTKAQLRGQNAQLRTQNAQARIDNARLTAEKKALLGELQLAKVRLSQTQKEAERARSVYAIQGISEKELRGVELLANEARTQYQTVLAKQASLAQVPALPISPLIDESGLGLGSMTADGSLPLRTPFSGVVTAVHKSLGEQVAQGEGILEVSNLRTVWLECPVFEKDLGALVEGMEATFSVLSYPKREFHGRLINIGSVIDEKTRATDVLFEVPNEEGELKLGMQADVRLAAAKTVEALVIPKEALLDRDGKKVVYVLVTGEAFERREVVITEDFGNLVGVTGKLSAGDRVVSQGAYQVFLQETNPAAPGVHSHET